MKMLKNLRELNTDTTALVLLGVLGQASEPMYGYQISKYIEANFKDTPTPVLKQNALYPVLRTLEKSGLLESEVEPSVSGPPRRYYKITDEGRETLQNWRKTWDRTKEFLDTILKGGE